MQKGKKVTQQPPIAYAQYRNKKWLMEPTKIKSSYLEVTNSNVT